MSAHAGVQKFLVIRLANLLRQPPEAIAFLEGILGSGRAGRATLHIKDGQILAWGFQPAAGKRELTRPRTTR